MAFPAFTKKLLTWLGRRFRRQSTGQQLARLAVATAEVRRRTEAKFLELANHLQALHHAAEELSRTTREQLTEIRAVLDEKRLTGAGGLAARSLDELHAEAGEAETRARLLESNSAVMRLLSGHGGQIERIASLLDVAGYGFAVESARSDASRKAFDSFVEELRRLAARVRVLGESIAREAEEARRESANLDRGLWESHSALNRLTGQAEAVVKRTSERAELALRQASEALAGIDGTTAQIAALANDAVYHLQFGDIVRQKLEHIESALGGVELDHSGPMLAVQAGQLDRIAGEIAASHRQIEQAFSRLAEETRGLLEATARFSGGGDRAASDPIEELRQAFVQIGRLRGRGRELRRRAAETSARARETAGRLSRYAAEVEDINWQMQLQALNAIVKTVRLGEEGRTLEVLSTYVGRLFEDSRGLVSETAGAIQNISAVAAGESPDACDAPDTSLALDAGLDRLADIRRQLTGSMETAAALAGEQETRLGQARTGLEFLSEMAADVAALGRDMIDSVPGDPAAGNEGAWGFAAARYTIASERDVHRRVTGEGAPPPEKDLGENVELF